MTGSPLFSPIYFGPIEAENRFVHTGCYEAMATAGGAVSDRLVRRYKKLGSAGIGLVVTGYMFVSRDGKANPYQVSIHGDRAVDGLARLAGAFHDGGGRIAFQLVHAGRQSTKEYLGENPMAPSRTRRDPLYLVKPRAMTGEDIRRVIVDYGQAARRAKEAGADAVHLSAAGGYLVNQFLSPFFNRRTDEWGGSAENRFRFLKEVVLAVKEAVGPGMAVIVKINAEDHTPGRGVILEDALQHAAWLKELGVDGLEVASGTLLYSHMNLWRGEVPVREIVQSQPGWKKPLAWASLKLLERRDTGFREAWNLAAAAKIRNAAPGLPVISVGGNRRLSAMEEAVASGAVDALGLCRPFLREPTLVKRFARGKAKEVSCTSCNRCLGAAANLWPIGCYAKGVPKTRGTAKDREE